MISPDVELNVNEFVLQIGFVILFAMDGFGFKVTVTTKLFPSHAPDVGVTV